MRVSPYFFFEKVFLRNTLMHSGRIALPFHQSLIPVNLTEPQQMKMDRLLRSERRVNLDCRRESEYGRRRKRWRLELACACEEETRRDSADRVAAPPSMLLFNALALALALTIDGN